MHHSSLRGLHLLLRFISMVTAICGCLQPARAQGEESATFADEGGLLFRADVSGTRPQPEYDPKGIKVDSFRVFTSITMATAFDSNVFNLASGKNADASASLEPRFRASSDWGLNQLDLTASARITRFASKGAENREEFGFSLSGRLDAENNDAAFGRIDFRQETEPRGAGGQRVLGAEPSAFAELNIGVATRQSFGPIKLQVSASVGRRTFDPIRLISGGRFDQAFRDTETIQISPRILFALTPDTGLFLAGTASRTKTLNPKSFSDRTATGRRILFGARGSIGNLVAAEVGLGVQARNYRAPQFRDYAGFAYSAIIDWYPTPLLSVRLTANQEFQNSGIVAVAAIRNNALQLATYYELLRNVKVAFTLRDERESYRELSIVTKTSSAIARVDLDIGPRLTAGLNLGFRRRGSTDPSVIGKYSGVTLALSLTGRM